MRQRLPYEFQQITDPKNAHVIMHDEYIYGVRGRAYAGSALLARKAFFEASRLWAEGAAKATGAAVAEAGPGVLGGAIRATWPGLVMSALWGARHQIHAAITGKDAGRIAEEQKFFEHRLFRNGPEGEKASFAFARMRALYEPPPKPVFMQPRPAAPTGIPAGESLPTFAALGGAGGSSPEIKPRIDSSEIKAAAGDAEHLKDVLGGLNVNVSPNVNAESLRSALGLATQLLNVVNQIGSSSSRAATSVQRGVAAGSHALHDGPEAH